MPVSKYRIKHVDLIREIASLLLIPESIMFLDVVNLKRSCIRIHTEGMDANEKARIRAKKDEVKDLTSKFDADSWGGIVKIAMSDRHPLGEAGQIEFEKRRRQARTERQKMRQRARKDGSND